MSVAAPAQVRPRRRQPRRFNRLAIPVLAAALLMLLDGAWREHRVYDPDTEEFGLLGFTRVTDRQMVVDATFGGVTRRNARLYSTYDRSAPQGKRACPT